MLSGLSKVLLSPGLTRRGFLGLAASALLLGAEREEPFCSEEPKERRLCLVNMNTRERFEGVFWRDGDYDLDALQKLNVLLRDHHTEKVAEFDPRLFDLLCRLDESMNTRNELEVISGYRSPRTNAQQRRRTRRVARQSLHMEAKAVDVRIPDVPTRQLRRAAMALRGGGVGSYRRSTYIHLDVGPVRIW